MKISNWSIFIAFVSLTILLSGCAPAPTSVPPTLTPLPTNTSSRIVTTKPTSSSETTRTQQSVQTIMPTATSMPVVPLSATGPWFVNIGRKDDEITYVLIFNEDGTGRSVLDNIQETVLGQRTSYSPASPWMAMHYMTSENDLILNIYHLPDSKPVRTISLLAEELPNNPLNGFSSIQDRRATYEFILHKLETSRLQAWSPDGRYFAFIGAVEGPSLDLYVFDTRDRSLHRLTSGSLEAIEPVWSPDGAWIILQEFVYKEGAPRFTYLTAVYAIRPDGSETKLLYKPHIQGGELLLGWLSAETFAVSTYDDACEGCWDFHEHDARFVNIYTGQIFPIYSGNIDRIVLDPESGIYAFVVGPGSEAMAQLPKGTYLKIPRSSAVRVFEAVSVLKWEPHLRMFLMGGPAGMLGLTLTGEITPFPATEECFPEPSPDGKWLAFMKSGVLSSCIFGEESQPGVRLYSSDGELIREISTLPTHDVIWRSDSAGFFFATTMGLYYVAIPDCEPVLVDEMGGYEHGMVGAGID